MTQQPYAIHRRETLFQGYFRIERLHLTVGRFDGTTMGSFTREVLERGHAVAILPYDPANDHVLLIEQFRPGALLAGDAQPWLIEIVAGIIDADEAPEQVARREAKEEANCIIEDLAHIMACYSSPGCMSEHVDLYIGRAKLSGTGGSFGLREEHEDIRTHILPFDTALAWLDEGRIKHSMAIITLQWLARHRGALRDQWLTGGQ